MKNHNIPIFVPHRGCPYNCVFCNQKRITGVGTDVTPHDVVRIISENLKTIDTNDSFTEAAFFGGSFTGIPIAEQNSLMDAAKKFVDNKSIDGIRLSTRPDYISEEIVQNLLNHKVTTIELGVQSMDSEVLEKSKRGHTQKDVERAVAVIKKYPIRLGLQMMTGLPGDTDEKSLYTAEEIIKLKPDMVRIYPTLTIADTYLEKMYKDGRYVPQTLDEAVEIAKQLLLKFEKNNIKVIRLGLQSTAEICENGSVIAGPVHSAFGELVENSIYYDIIREKLVEKKDCDVFVNPSEISKAVGNKKININKFKSEMGINVKIHGDKNLKKREVRCSCC